MTTRLPGHARSVRRGWWLLLLAFAPMMESRALRAAPAVSGAQASKERKELESKLTGLLREKRIDAAIPVAERLVSTIEASAGPKSDDVANALEVLGMLHRGNHDLKRAELALERCLRIKEALHGAEGAELGQPLLELGRIAYAAGDSNRALEANRRALLVLEKRYGTEHKALLPALAAVEGVYLEQKNYAALDPLYLRSLRIREQVSGPESEEVMVLLGGIGRERALNHDFKGAEAYYRKAISLREKHPDTTGTALATAYTDLAVMLEERGEPASLYTRAAAIYERAQRESELLRCVNRLAMLYAHANDYRSALPFLERALSLEQKLNGPESDQTAVISTNLGIAYDKLGEYAKAEPVLLRSVELTGKSPGERSPEMATVLANLAEHFVDTGDLRRARPLLERALSIREALGDKRTLAMSIQDLARLEASLGEFESAERDYARAFDLLKSSVGTENQDAAQLLGNWASLCADRGDYARATSLGEQALGISERVMAPDDPDLGYPTNNLGDFYKERGAFERAEELYKRAYAIWSKQFGAESEQAAIALNNLGALYKARGNYAAAQDFIARALKATARVQGDSHPHTAIAFNNLAELYADRGDYAQAAPLLERALSIWQSSLGANHPQVALAMNNLGALYFARGDNARAEDQFRRALAINQALGNDANTARTLANLAQVYDRQDRVAEAELLLRQAISKLSASLGASHPDVAEMQIGLASARAAQGDNREAEKLSAQACQAISAAAGAASPAAARCDASLAHALAANGNYTAAAPLYERAIRSFRQIFGSDHPQLAQILVNQAIFYWMQGDAPRAITAMRDGLDVRERHVVRATTSGSEAQRKLFLAASSWETDWAVDLHEDGFAKNTDATKLALLAVLRRKGRLLDVMSDTTRSLREHLSSDERALFEHLRALRTDIARRTLAGPPPKTDPQEFTRTLGKLEQEADEVEQSMAAKSAAFQRASRPVTLTAVAESLRPGSALLEITSHLGYDPRAGTGGKWQARRYGAYVLRPNGDVLHADLGPAATLDPLVAALRLALSNPRSDAKTPSRALGTRLMGALSPLLRGVTHLYVAADGALDLVPFGALIDERNQYLLENLSISYLSSGRDLMRTTDEQPRSSPLVVVNPAFDAQSNVAPGTATTARGLRLEVDMSRMHFSALPGTEEEGRAVAGSLKDAGLLSGTQATTSALSGLHAPSVLHIATHGFFLDAPIPSPAGSQRTLSNTTRDVAVPPNPLLRSGLAFAGANLHRAEDPGILTALEASSLDLSGTRLVVLSACDTGVGDVATGEGVYGMRRAMLLAGAESLVMSLWQVSDQATRDLMTAYYAELARGAGRAEGLRSVQLEMSHTPGLAHPYYWASFVAFGADGPLGSQGGLPPALESGMQTGFRPPPVAPFGAARGCGCRSAVGSGTEPWLLASGLSVFLSMLRRRRREVCVRR